MSIIGTFTPTNDGGWSGTIRTLSINAKVKLVPNDNRGSDGAPVFHLIFGHARIGEAWEARSAGEHWKEYLRVKVDDPSFVAPLNAVLFPTDDGTPAKLVWSRQRRTA
jgi:uncharacterized protein (DUF736 family)